MLSKIIIFLGLLPAVAFAQVGEMCKICSPEQTLRKAEFVAVVEQTSIEAETSLKEASEWTALALKIIDEAHRHYSAKPKLNFIRKALLTELKNKKTEIDFDYNSLKQAAQAIAGLRNASNLHRVVNCTQAFNALDGMLVTIGASQSKVEKMFQKLEEWVELFAYFYNPSLALEPGAKGPIAKWVRTVGSAPLDSLSDQEEMNFLIQYFSTLTTTDIYKLLSTELDTVLKELKDYRKEQLLAGQSYQEKEINIEPAMTVEQAEMEFKNLLRDLGMEE